MKTALKKTKIVATIGPATESEEMLTKLIQEGLNVIRLNFSHGDFAEHQLKLDNARKAAKKLGARVAILQDLSGPKIRIGDFYQDRVQLKKGSTFTLKTEKITGNEQEAYVNYPTLPEEVSKGQIIMLDDGKKQLEVTKVGKGFVETKVLVGGDTKGRRGVNIPGANLSISALTEKDKKDIAFGVKNDVEFFALSFVRRVGDIEELRAILKRKKCDAHIIAKIETQEAVDNFEEILTAVDGVMVARGDLAIEVPAEKVPLIQKRIIALANAAGKPVITATQMLESMIHSPVPTRAEVSDVANAIYDGTDAVMLSEETTLGEYPLEAVKVMARVAKETEESFFDGVATNETNEMDLEGVPVTDSVTASVVNTANEVNAKTIVALTDSGLTARMISRYRPKMPILALSGSEKTCNRLALSFGCFPEKVERFGDLKNALEVVRRECVNQKLASRGDKVIVSAGVPFHEKQSVKTNMLVVLEI
ncbi:MAG TPA: pyruvate kinase [Candidatus Paceibacterota bacterium]|nr:pyruvate kinase [Candidatus Paceibacterota bacterium]